MRTFSGHLFDEVVKRFVCCINNAASAAVIIDLFFLNCWPFESIGNNSMTHFFWFPQHSLVKSRCMFKF